MGPVDLSTRYQRRCLAKSESSRHESDTKFCAEKVFDLTLANDVFPTPCRCNPFGSESRQCVLDGGQCPCKPGFKSRDCSICEEGYYPYCKPKGSYYNYFYRSWKIVFLFFCYSVCVYFWRIFYEMALGAKFLIWLDTIEMIYVTSFHKPDFFVILTRYSCK